MASGIPSMRGQSGHAPVRRTNAATAAPPKFHGWFGFFPALPLKHDLAFGEWIVGSPSASVRWEPSEFRALSMLLYDSFAPRFAGGAKLWHRDNGFDGTSPDLDDLRAI